MANVLDYQRKRVTGRLLSWRLLMGCLIAAALGLGGLGVWVLFMFVSPIVTGFVVRYRPITVAIILNTSHWLLATAWALQSPRTPYDPTGSELVLMISAVGLFGILFAQLAWIGWMFRAGQRTEQAG